MIRGLSVVVLARALLLVVAALLVVVLGRVLPLMPDLVLPVVVAAALLRGPVSGALVGLTAGWVLDLMPPGSQLLGSTALLYAVAGALAGFGRRRGPVGASWVGGALALAALVVAGGRLLQALLVGAPVDLPLVLSRLAVSVLVGLVMLVPLLRMEQRAARGSVRGAVR